MLHCFTYHVWLTLKLGYVAFVLGLLAGAILPSGGVLYAGPAWRAHLNAMLCCMPGRNSSAAGEAAAELSLPGMQHPSQGCTCSQGAIRMLSTHQHSC